MSKKISKARTEAFFRALEETGNQTLAAERAKVSRSWVTLHRADPAFRARIEAATAAARAALLKDRSKGSVKPGAARWGSCHEEELVVRGGRGRRLQIARARLHQWTPRIEQRFLNNLAATCNVKAACAAVGMSTEGAYAHAKRWPGFARRWDEALRMGEGFLVGQMNVAAMNLFSGREIVRDCKVKPIGIDEAIRLVRLHERRVHGTGKWAGRQKGV